MPIHRMVKKITCLLTVGILPILFYVSSQKWLLIESPIFAANQIYRIMYSSEDLERFYFQYQTEALPHGESLQSFCVKNKVPYNIFQKWYRDTRKKVVEVQVDGAPVIGHEEQSSAIDQPQPVSPGRTDHPVRIWVEIRISNGLHLSQKNLSYQDLVRMVEKLEGLC
mgnify:FL=1